MGAKDAVVRKPVTPGALGHGMADPKGCPPWNPAKNQHMLSGPHGGRKPVLGKAPELPEADAEYRGSARARVEMEKPNSLDELKRACARTFKVNDVRIFHEGTCEVTGEDEYKRVGVGDRLVVADASGQSIGIERRKAERSRVEFTAISEAQASYVPKVHGQPGVFYPGPYRQKEWRKEWLEQREREAVVTEPPRPYEQKPNYPSVFGEPSTAALDRHAAKYGDGPVQNWTHVGKSERVESEMREQFKRWRPDQCAPRQDRKSLTASDFSLFAHKPAGGTSRFEGRSETQANFENPREKPTFEPPRRGVPEMPETEGHKRAALRRQNLQNPHTEKRDAWWRKGKFTGSSEMANNFTDPTGKQVGDCVPVRGAMTDWCTSDYFKRTDTVFVEPCRKLAFKGTA